MKFLLLITLTLICMSSCSKSQNLGPDYDFALFKGTPYWTLAQLVEKEDTNGVNKILNDDTMAINFQEPKYGKTLLSLSVSNGKTLSVKTLLEHGASLTITDSNHYAAIHQATIFIPLRTNVVPILELLLKYGADPNASVTSTFVYDTANFYLPLMGAIENVECTKLLLSYGANMYYKKNDGYPVWKELFLLDAPYNENIFVARYLIVDKKMKIPNPVFYTIPDHQPWTAIELLKKFNVGNDTKKKEAKDAILNYLKKINFPDKDVY